MTNAYTESVNSVIRELDRVGHGSKFETMRGLMPYDETDRSKKTSTRSRRPKAEDDVIGFFDVDFGVDDEDEDLTKRPPEFLLANLADMRLRLGCDLLRLRHQLGTPVE